MFETTRDQFKCQIVGFCLVCVLGIQRGEDIVGRVELEETSNAFDCPAYFEREVWKVKWPKTACMEKKLKS